MPEQPKLLFLSPDWPRQTGNGIAMRSWAAAQALGRRYEVYYYAPAFSGPPPSILPRNVRAVASSGPLPPLQRLQRFVRAHLSGLYPYFYRIPSDWPQSPSLPPALLPLNFQQVHIYRLAMAPYADRFLGKIPCNLDLDESESRTRRKIADLYRRNGLVSHSRIFEAESRHFEQQEQHLHRFSRVTVSSHVEREHVSKLGIVATVVPNTVPVPELPEPQSTPGRPHILLVGTLNYYPNQDAARFLAQEIVPRLRRSHPDIRVTIAGNGPLKLRRELAADPSIECPGFVTDLEPLYQSCHVVVAPIRAGGGTRIKILEAFAHSRAVIATQAGAEGILAESGKHLILADSPEDFAQACLRLIADGVLREAIACAGHQLAFHNYRSETLDLSDGASRGS